MSNNPLEKVNLGDMLIPSFIKNAVEEPSKEIGKLVATTISACFTPLKKWHMIKEYELKEFGKLLDDKLSKIPIDERRVPKMSLIGPAIEASQYYYEDETLRELFAELISSACDERQNEYVHPSFVETIKQLSVLDAQVLSKFRKENIISFSTSMAINDKVLSEGQPQPAIKNYIEIVMPIVQILLKNSNEKILLQSNVCFDIDIDVEMFLLTSSIENLHRLGLIDINYSGMKVTSDKYKKFFEHKYYQTIKAKYLQSGRDPNSNSLGFVNIRGNSFYANSFADIELIEGIVRLTQYGYNFSKTCIQDEKVEAITN